MSGSAGPPVAPPSVGPPVAAPVGGGMSGDLLAAIQAGKKLNKTPVVKSVPAAAASAVSVAPAAADPQQAMFDAIKKGMRPCVLWLT